MARHIMAEYGLKEEDCLLIYSQRPNFPLVTNSTSVAQCVYYDNRIYRSYGLALNHEIKRINRIPHEVFNKCEYICYANTTRSWLAQSLIGGKNCIGYHIVEEGMAAYTIKNTTMDSSIKERMRRYLALTSSAGRIGHFGVGTYYTSHPKFLTAICCHEAAFPGIDRKEVIGWPFARLEGYEDVQALFVFDGGSTSEEFLRDAICRLANECWSGRFESVAYKFHPNQQQEERRRLKLLFEGVSIEHNIRPIELNDVILENLCLSRGRALSVYFILSSVGFYAAMMGCESVSVARAHPAAWRTVSGLPPAVTRGVVFL